MLARFTVMLAEAAESVRLIGEFLGAGTAAGAARSSANRAAPGSAGPNPRAARRSPGSRSATDGRITRARLRPASARNWRGFDDACRSQNVFTDIPIIEASFWLTAAGMAR